MSTTGFSNPVTRRWIAAGFSVLLAASLIAGGARPAFAVPPAEPLAESPHRKIHRYTVDKGASVDAGAARAQVNASADALVKVLTDYEKYSDAVKEFQQAKIVGRHKDKTDVYVRVPILKDTVVIWSVLRFSPPRKNDKGETIIEARQVKGNVDRFDVLYRVKPAEGDHAELSIELLIKPNLPFPSGVVTTEVQRAAYKAVRGFRKHTEKKH